MRIMNNARKQLQRANQGLSLLGQRGAGGFTPSDVPQAEADALIALYDATDGDNWDDNTGWKTDPVVGNWFGVTVSGGNVTQLELNNNSLNGTIPSDIGDLTSLTILRLHANSLSGSIPTEIGNLTSLTTLWLHDNSLSGSIPTEIGNLTSLTDLRLHQNSLSGVETGALQLPAATTIRIDGNGMSESVVDDALWDIYQTTRTASNGTVNVGGSNAAPSGTHQAAASCPVDANTPGKEICHELANDGCSAGINTWATVTFSA